MTKLSATKFSFTLLALFFSLTAFASALPDFSITATATAQTCLGNGSLAFTVSGTTAGATLDYKIYKLPNTATPVATVTASPVLSLTAGDYKIVATQTLGPEQNTAETTVTIANEATPLSFNLTLQKVRCGNDGTITVNVTAGTATQYEITAGPVTKPLQPSNIFTGLPAGQYQVRAFDSCGDASVVTITLGTALPHIAIDGVSIEPGILPSCNTINVRNFYGTLSGYEIFYPLTFVYTIMPPGGAPAITQTVTVNSGTNGGGTLTTTIPFYHNQSYYYNLKVTDACGNVYNRNNNTVNQKLTVNVNPEIEGCTDNKFGIGLANFRPPYTVTFTSPTPAAFMANPAAYNAAHPNFTDNAVYGGEGNPVPEGNYTVIITDACGRTASKSFEVSDPDMEPGLSAEVEGCSATGEITISGANSDLVLVKVLIAPPAFSAGPYPMDISSEIDGQELVINDAPLGYYQFEITDECGGPYTKDITVQVTGADPNMTVVQRPGCALGMGSVRLSINPSNVFTSVKITQSPPEFATSFPVDVSANIHGFNFSMNSLPAGVYTFETIDDCGTPRNRQLTIDGYQVTVNTIELTPLCQSFQLKPLHTSNGTYTASYWLQKYNAVSDTWGHPDGTGSPYLDGTLPGATNSLPININVNNINLQYLGEFRILKVFYTFNNGISANQRCIEVINTFIFDNKPRIVDTHVFPCAGGLVEAAVEAIGVEPLVYKITHKNGGPFVVNNGTSSLFSGLEPATYIFQLTDVCGNLNNQEVTINAVDPIEITQTGQCAESPITLSVPAFSFLNFQWYKQGQPGTILSTTASLEFPSFNPAAQAGTYVLQITSSTANSCLNQTITHTVNVLPQPNAGQDASTIICNSGTSINVASLLTSAHDAGGTWTDLSSTGQFSGTNFNTAGMVAGTYQFKYSVTGSCSQTDDAIISITLKNKPAAPVITPLAALCEGTGGQLITATIPNATYQWTGPANFTSTDQSPVFTAFTTTMAGNYTVRATVDGCTSDPTTVTVTVNAIPQFTIDGASLLCENQNTTLTINPTNFTVGDTNISYTWYEGTNQLPGVNASAIQVFNPGTYSVVVSNNGCDSQPIVHTISQNAITTPISIVHGCENDAYIVRVANADAFPDTAFEWTGPDGYTGNGSFIDISGLPAGNYALTLTNTDGCTAGNSAEVINTYCKIPRGISPNGDGDNDAFDLTNFDVEEIKIFNRYGLQVYEKKRYIKDWHGQSDKGDLPAGTYYYVLKMAGGREKTGWVYLQLNE